MQTRRVLNNGTSDIKQNLANLSSTTFKPDLFSAVVSAAGLQRQPSRKRADSNFSNLSRSSSFKAAFGVNMRGSGVFKEELMDVTPKDPKCAGLADPAMNAAKGLQKKKESFGKSIK